MPEKFLSQSRESGTDSPDDIFASTEKLKSVIGFNAPMTDNPLLQMEAVSLTSIDSAGKALDRAKYLHEEPVLFEDLVLRNVLHEFMQYQLFLQNPEQNLLDMTTLQEISLRMTLWKYEELELKEYIDAIDRYQKNLDMFGNREELFSQFPYLQKLESDVHGAILKLHTLLPTYEALTRLVWCVDLQNDKVTMKKLSNDDKKQLSDLEISLRSRLSELHSPLSSAELKSLRPAQDNYAGLIREVLQKTTAVSGREVQLSHALFIATLGAERQLSYEAIQNEKSPKAKTFEKFLSIQNALTQESLSYHIDTLKNNADTTALLAMRERFGPATSDTLDADFSKMNSLQKFYEEFVLPPALTDALQKGDLRINLEGMRDYVDLVSHDATNYGSIIENLDSALIIAKDKELFLMDTKHTLAGGAYFVPEWTLGWGRSVGLDYAKLIGQEDKLKNHREYEKFKKLEIETETIREMMNERKPRLLELREQMLVDKDKILELQKKYPPENCAPGIFIDGVSYDEIRKLYKSAIQSLRDHHSEFLTEVDGLYSDMHASLSYHVGRQKELELLTNEEAPSFWGGVGLSTGILVALERIGKYGGLKSVTPFHYAARIINHVPVAKNVMRIANAPTRPVTGMYDLIARRYGLRALPRVDERSRARILKAEKALKAKLHVANQTISEQSAELARRNAILPKGEISEKVVENLDDSLQTRRVFRNGKWEVIRGGMARFYSADEIRMLKQQMSPGLRLELGRRLLGRKELSSAERKLVLEIHKPGRTLKQKFYSLVEGVDEIKEVSTGEVVTFSKAEADILLRNGICGPEDMEGVVRALRNTGNNRLADSLIREAGILRNARGLPWGMSLPVIATVREGVALRHDIYSLADAITYTDDVRQQLHQTLIPQGFVYNPKEDSFAKGSITLRVNEDILRDLADTKLQAAKNRIGKDITIGALATSAMFMETGVGLPLGMLIAAGAITVDMNIHADERDAALEFIESADPYLLAYMGTAITGFDESDMLYTTLYDMYATEPTVETRGKILFCLFAHVLKNDPERMRNITGGDFSPETLNEFYVGDFQNFVLPSLSVAIFCEQSGKYAQGVSYKEAKNFQFQSMKGSHPNALPGDVFNAMQKTLDLYEQKLTEERYVSLSRELKIAVEEKRYDDVLEIDSMLSIMGRRTIFGKSLSSVGGELLQHDEALLLKNADAPIETRTQIALRVLTDKMHKNEALSYADMFALEAKNPGLAPLRITREETGWQGTAMPSLLHAELLSKELKKAFGYDDAPSLFSQDKKLSPVSESLLSRIDPGFHARMMTDQVSGLQPYERTDLMRASPGISMEFGEIDGMQVYGTSFDGKDVQLLARKGSTLYTKTYTDVGPHIPWEIVQGGETFVPQMDIDPEKRSKPVQALMPLLTVPIMGEDAESIRRIVTLFSSMKEIEESKNLKLLIRMYQAVPSGEIEKRSAFLSDVLFVARSPQIGIIRRDAGMKPILAEIITKAQSGAYGTVAQKKIPEIAEI